MNAPHSQCYIFACSLSSHSFYIPKSHSYISCTKVHLFISYTKVHLIHFVIHFHLNHFIDHSPTHSHLTHLVILILHHISTSFFFVFQSIPAPECRSVFTYKVLIWNTYCIICVLLLLVTLQESQNAVRVKQLSCNQDLCW